MPFQITCETLLELRSISLVHSGMTGESGWGSLPPQSKSVLMSKWTALRDQIFG